MSSPDKEGMSATGQRDTPDLPKPDVAEKKQTPGADDTQTSRGKLSEVEAKATDEKDDAGTVTKDDDAAAKARERLERFKALKARAVSILLWIIYRNVFSRWLT
jgi:hypothetical protein